MTAVDVFVPGIPVPQGSTKAFVRGGRAIVTSANAKLRPWRSTVSEAWIVPRPSASAARPRTGASTASQPGGQRSRMSRPLALTERSSHNQE